MQNEDRQSPSPYSICPFVFMSVVIAGMVMGVQQQWLLLYLCQRFAHSPSSAYLPGLLNVSPISLEEVSFEICRSIPDIQSLAARWGMVLALCSGIPALFMGPYIGIMSDKIGRRPIMMLGMLSALLVYSTYITISYGFGLWILILASFTAGLMGSWMILLTGTMAYFADTSVAADRATVFVIGESVFFAGFAIGPFIGGLLGRKIGVEKVFIIAFFMKLTLLLTTFALLPESLKNVKDRPLGKVEDIKKIFKKAASPSFIYLILGMMASLAASQQRTIFFFYVSYTFGWDSQDEGQYLLVMCLTRMTHMLLIYPILTRLFRKTLSETEGKARFDLTLIRVGVLVSSTCALLQAFSTKGWNLYIITILDGFATLANPTNQSLLSASVPAVSQGLLFSGLSFISSSLGLIFGVVFPTIWSATVRTRPNSFLFVTSFIYFLSFVAFLGPKVESVLLQHSIVVAEEVAERDDSAVDLLSSYD